MLVTVWRGAIKECERKHLKLPFDTRVVEVDNVVYIKNRLLLLRAGRENGKKLLPLAVDIRNNNIYFYSYFKKKWKLFEITDEYDLYEYSHDWKYSFLNRVGIEWEAGNWWVGSLFYNLLELKLFSDSSVICEAKKQYKIGRLKKVLSVLENVAGFGRGLVSSHMHLSFEFLYYFDIHYNLKEAFNNVLYEIKNPISIRIFGRDYNEYAGHFASYREDDRYGAFTLPTDSDGDFYTKDNGFTYEYRILRLSKKIYLLRSVVLLKYACLHAVKRISRRQRKVFITHLSNANELQCRLLDRYLTKKLEDIILYDDEHFNKDDKLDMYDKYFDIYDKYYEKYYTIYRSDILASLSDAKI